jgi:hypothetical protein
MEHLVVHTYPIMAIVFLVVACLALRRREAAVGGPADG